MTVKRVTLGIPVDVLEWCLTHNIEMDICIEVEEEVKGDPEYEGPPEEHEGETIVRFADSMRWHLEGHIVDDLKEVAGFRDQINKLHENAGRPVRDPTYSTESDRVLSALERHLFQRPDGSWRIPNGQSPEERLLEAIFSYDESPEEHKRHLTVVPDSK